MSDGPQSGLIDPLKHFNNVQYVQMGRNQQSIQGGWGAIPRLVGTYFAKGKYIAYLDDDNEYYPDHIDSLVGLLERTNSDIVFSQQQREGHVLGTGQVQLGLIDTSMVLHKAEILWTTANWRAAGYTSDADLFMRWRDAGLKWEFLPRVTHKYN